MASKMIFKNLLESSKYNLGYLRWGFSIGVSSSCVEFESLLQYNWHVQFFRWIDLCSFCSRFATLLQWITSFGQGHICHQKCQIILKNLHICQKWISNGHKDWNWNTLCWTSSFSYPSTQCFQIDNLLVIFDSKISLSLHKFLLMISFHDVTIWKEGFSFYFGQQHLRFCLLE